MIDLLAIDPMFAADYRKRLEALRERRDPDAMFADRPLYERQGSVAVIPIRGFMTPEPWGSWLGTHTPTTIRAIREARRDPDVEGIFLDVSSGGGMVAGTDELSREVAAANADLPVHAHIDHVGASAAYWVAVPARTITANRTGVVGSIGVVSAALDSSKWHEDEGLRVIPLSTGHHKHTGMPGVPIDDKQVAALQRLIDDSFSYFRAAVSEGRQLRGSALGEVTDGRMFPATEASELGLIDGVMSRDESFTTFFRSLEVSGSSSRS